MRSQRAFFCLILLLSSCALPFKLEAKGRKTPASQPPKHSCEPFVTAILRGQLGNHMFIVAAASAVAWDRGIQAYFPDLDKIKDNPEGYYQHIFYNCNILPPCNQPHNLTWEGPTFSYATIPYRPRMKISGYLQNERYFARHRKKILELFAPNPNDLNYVQTKYDWILSHPNSVSIHLRHYRKEVSPGDFQTFLQYDHPYYEKAMSHFPEDALFVVMSDDLNFAKENIPTEGRNVVFIENERYYIDFLLQRLCKHNIICNSTFSWWSAWLNENPDKIVIRPKRWLGHFPDLQSPNSWIKLDIDPMQ